MTHLKQEIQKISSLIQVWGCLRIKGREEAMTAPQLGIQKKNVCTKTRKKDGKIVSMTSRTNPTMFGNLAATSMRRALGSQMSLTPLRMNFEIPSRCSKKFHLPIWLSWLIQHSWLFFLCNLRHLV